MRGVLLLCLVCSSLVARDITLSPGAGGQLQFTLLQPAAAASATLTADLDPAVFEQIVSASAFSSSGDASGYVTIDKLHLEVHVWSPLRGLGRVAGQPVFVVNVRTLPGVPDRVRVPILAQTSLTDSTPGAPLAPVPFDVESVTVQGTLSMSDVHAESASVVQVLGGGFSNATSLEIEGAVVSNVSVVSDRELAVTLAGPTEIVGKRVRVRNPEGAIAEFWPSVQAGAPDPAKRRPIFPLRTLRYATADYIRLRSGTVFLRNPGSEAVDVQLVATDTSRSVLRTTPVTLRPGESWSGITTDLGAYASSSYLYVYASAPLFMLQLMHVTPIFSIPPDSYDYAAPFTEMEAPRLAFSYPADNVSWTWQTGTALPEAKTVRLNAAQGNPEFPFRLTKAAGDWLTVTASSNTVCSFSNNCSPTELILRANPTGLTPGVYRGTVTLTPAANRVTPDTSPMVIPVALTVTATPFANTALAYVIFVQPGGSLTETETIRPDIVPGAFTVSVLTGSAAKWLTATPASGTSPGSVTLTANSTGLATGTYSAHVVVQGSGNTQIFETLLFVYSGTRLRAGNYYLHFGGSGSQVLSVTPDCQVTGCTTEVPKSLPLTASAQTNTGGNWLAVSTGSNAITVRTSASGLAPGLYTGSVTVRSPELPGPTEIPVVLTIPDRHAPALLASPTSVDLFAAPGGTVSRFSFVMLSGFTPSTFEARVLTRNGGDWLRVEASQGVTPGSVTLSADATKLDAGVYAGELVITAPGQSLSVPVTLRVGQPFSGPAPLIGAVVNAASMRAGSIAAEEIVTIFGSGLTGSVLVDGLPANVLYASGRQLNAVVPQGIRGRSAAKLDVGSATWTVPVAPAAPGVFGILNQDNSRNTESTPSRRGSVIQLFGTGFDTQDVSVTVDGTPAQVLFAGQAPGAVAGLFQINVMLPAQGSSGTVPLVIQTSGASTTTAVAVTN